MGLGILPLVSMDDKHTEDYVSASRIPLTVEDADMIETWLNVRRTFFRFGSFWTMLNRFEPFLCFYGGRFGIVLAVRCPKYVHPFFTWGIETRGYNFWRRT